MAHEQQNPTHIVEKGRGATRMDSSSVLLILSNLLHLHNNQHNQHGQHQLLADSGSPAPNSSPAPLLLLLTLASLVSSSSSSSTGQTSARPPRRPSPSPFRSLTSPRSLRLPPPERDPLWRSACGLSYPVFATLAEQLGPHLRRSASVPALFPPDLALFVALSRLARGVPPRSLARSHSFAPSLVSKLTNAVTRMLSTLLFRDYVKLPSGHRLLQIVHAFKDISSLPNVCGAIDTSPIKLKRTPTSDESDAYLCRHGFPAVLLQVVADHRKIFWDVCIKAPGSVDDASHFRDSHLYSRFIKGEILRDAVVTVQGLHVRPYVVGDYAFPLLSFLLTPFTADNSGDFVQNTFDAALMCARAASVEPALRLLKGRWKILRELNVGIDHAAQTVVACCVLHNMCQIAGEPEDDRAYEWQEPKGSAPPAGMLQRENQSLCAGENLRNAISRDLYEKQQRQPTGGRGR